MHPQKETNLSRSSSHIPMHSMSGLAAATVVSAAIIVSLLLPSAAAPSALLIQTSEAFPSKSNPHRLFPSTVALQPAPAPGTYDIQFSSTFLKL
jgi:hypothetical protein